MAQRSHTKEFVVGAAVGSLLGSVAALLVAPKAGEDLREDLCDAYCNVADKAQDWAKKSKSFADDVSCQTCDWADRAKSAVNGATKTIKGWVSEEEDTSTRDLLIGGAIGGVIGLTAALLLAPKSGDRLRQDLVDTYEDISERTHDFANGVSKRGKAFAKTARSRTNKWVDLAKNIIDDLSEGAQERGEEWIEQAKGLVNNKRVNDILNWAQVGYRVWNGLQSRKR